MVIASLLEKLGCVVDVAVNGEDAVRKLRQKTYGLVLMDCHMPVMDGYAATRLIREERGGAPPIVALTANDAMEDRERAKAAGMNDYLSKPFIKPDLIAIMSRWLV